MARTIIVKRDEIQASRFPNIFASYGVADCLAVLLYDTKVRAGALSHLFYTKKRAILGYQILGSGFVILQSTKVAADTVVDEMLFEMEKYNFNPRNVVAKMAGEQEEHICGEEIQYPAGGDEKSKIIKLELKKHEIPLVAEDLGGSRYIARDLTCDLATGELRIISYQKMKRVYPPDTKIEIISEKVI
jgi:chemotaxis receptor (MCP) glutamine deamidase CheD